MIAVIINWVLNNTPKGIHFVIILFIVAVMFVGLFSASQRSPIRGFR